MTTTIPPYVIMYRPPVEAFSVLIAVTGGCSWNKCKFCGMYKNADGSPIQEHAIRPLKDVLRDIDTYSAKNYHGYPVFLAGGNATSAPTEYLVEIIKHVRNKLNDVPRISCYCKALDVLRKNEKELDYLAKTGLTIVYMGLESGSNKILRIMKKGTNAESFIKAGKKILNAGIKLSMYVLLGLGSYELTEEHVSETARVLTEINPTIFRFRTLNMVPTAPLWNDWKAGKFDLLKPVDCLREEREIIARLGDNVTSQVYNDHVSNYCSIETTNIKEDRELFLKTLDYSINDPSFQKLPRENRMSL